MRKTIDNILKIKRIFECDTCGQKWISDEYDIHFYSQNPSWIVDECPTFGDSNNLAVDKIGEVYREELE